MLKKTIEYVDYDGQKKSTTEFFHLHKLEFLKMQDLKDRMQELYDRLDGLERDLQLSELSGIFDLVSELVNSSYGERRADGGFYKSPEILARFRATPAYDEFMISLFRDDGAALMFMRSIIPPDWQNLEGLEGLGQDQLPFQQTDTTQRSMTAMEEMAVQNPGDATLAQQEMLRAAERARLQAQMDALDAPTHGG